MSDLTKPSRDLLADQEFPSQKEIEGWMTKVTAHLAAALGVVEEADAFLDLTTELTQDKAGLVKSLDRYKEATHDD